MCYLHSILVYCNSLSPKMNYLPGVLIAIESFQFLFSLDKYLPQQKNIHYSAVSYSRSLLIRPLIYNQYYYTEVMKQ